MMYIENGDKNLCSIASICKRNYASALAEYLTSNYPFDSSVSCMRKITRFIYEHLVETYDYGKQWTVFISSHYCAGRKDTNVVEIDVDSFKVTVYFSNPVRTPVSMPFEDIKATLGSKLENIFSMWHLWKSFCPFPFTGKTRLMENVYKRIESKNYCEDRKLCISCAETSAGYVTDMNADIKLFAPCAGRPFIPVIMGPKDNEETWYPSEDKFDDDLFGWVSDISSIILEVENSNTQIIERENDIQKVIVMEDFAEEIS